MVAPQTNSEVRHRKNAAEWAMWIVLQPVAWVMRATRAVKGG
jgi:hypothetical protein